ncbi:MAG: S46 family peptidase [Polyangiaceae bacterium]|nr:S46 family peptidase [Polyangiaceae bacterium]
MRARSCLAPTLALAFLGCSPAASNPDRPDPNNLGQPTGSPTGLSTVAPRPEPPPPIWENPGGMWMPSQLAAQADTLKKVGFTIDPAALTKPTEFPLGAIVFLGGCSASFVSPDGLIVTNHHCVTGALQFNSKPDQNLLVDGYLSKSRAEEKSAGPAARVFVTQSFKDVTKEMRDGLDGVKDDLARYQSIEDRQKKLVAECEKGREGVRCSVASFFGAGQFTLIEQLEIRDVRLVYAPPEGIGNFGGETDNWRWPRHGGDFAFYRAYVSKDGKPADFAEGNVPYRPPHVLRLAKKPLSPNDAVLVAGYPGRTNRLTTAAEVKEAVEYDQPYTIDFAQTYLAELEKIAKTDKDLAIKAETFIRGLANWLTNTKGQLEGLTKDGLLAKKVEAEAELEKWIAAAPERKAKYDGTVSKVSKVFLDSRKTREADNAVRELLRMVRLFGAAHTIVRNAEEKAKPDAQRDPEFQERNQKRIEQGIIQLSKSYSPVLDKAMLKLVVARELKLPADKRAGIAEALLGKPKDAKAAQPYAQADIDKAIDDLFANATLGDEATRVKLLTKGTTAELKSSKDPMIKLALALRPKTKAYEERGKRLSGAMALVRPAFVEAMREKAGGVLAPDANATLRVTYGTVRGYSPKPGAPVYYPFTTLSEMVKKHTGQGEFDAPKALLDAAAKKKLGPYVDPQLGDVPVDFLSDLDITGGNSGSATLNARGELVGLAFDGNYESMASDWVFMPNITRSIHVDLRFMLWVMDAVSGADNLLKEMGVEPAIQN